MLNKVDGIKKLSKKELEESRKIVLASINEEFKKGQELLEGNNKTPNKKVDGIFSSLKQLKNNNKQQVQKKEITDTEKKEWKKEIGKIVEIEKPRFKISGFGVMKNLKNIQNQEDLHKKDKKNDLQISNNNKQAVRGLVANKKEEEKRGGRKKKKRKRTVNFKKTRRGETNKRKRAPQGGERKTTKNSEKKENKRTI